MARMAGRFVSWFTHGAKAFKPTPGNPRQAPSSLRFRVFDVFGARDLASRLVIVVATIHPKPCDQF